MKKIIIALLIFPLFAHAQADSIYITVHHSDTAKQTANGDTLHLFISSDIENVDYIFKSGISYNHHSKKKYGFSNRDLILTLSCFATASLCDAAMDAMTDHYDNSVFTRFNNPHFWNHAISWKYAPIYAGYHFDAWHETKSFGIIVATIPTAELLHRSHPIIKQHARLDRAVWYAIAGLTWNVVFNAGYNHLFVK